MDRTHDILWTLLVSLSVIVIIISITLIIKYNKSVKPSNLSNSFVLTSDKVEHYYDITPYEAHWNIFKCLDQECIRKKGYECYEWCKNWEESGGSENCKMRCADYADEMFDSLKYQNYTWNYLLPRFDKVSILKDRDDIVEWNTKDHYPHIHNKQYSRKYNKNFIQ